MDGEISHAEQSCGLVAEGGRNEGRKAISVTNDSKNVFVVQNRACLKVHLLRGLQDCGNTFAIIDFEWRLGCLKAQFEPGIAFEDEFIDNLSDFGSELHEVDEGYLNFDGTAGKENEDGQYFTKESYLVATYAQYKLRR
jgi:hypothetical protein